MDPRKDYYKILGIGENASQDDIKKAYRKLAKEYHPDKHAGDKNAEDKFKDISDAYSILGNLEKRKKYDMFRKNPWANQGGYDFQNAGSGGFRFDVGGSGFDISDVFGNLFGGGGRRRSGFSGGFEDLFGGNAQTQTSKGKDLETKLTISFTLAATGGETIINTSNGKKVKIKIPAGIEDGKKIKISGHGQAAPGSGEAGDLYAQVSIAPHPEFERKDNDILKTVKINMAEALLGKEITVNTIHGKRVKLKIPGGTSTGKTFRLAGLGIHSKSGTGDFLVKVEVTVPSHLTATQLKQFKEWAHKSGLV